MDAYSGDEPSLASQLPRPRTDTYYRTEKPVERGLEVFVIFSNTAGTGAALLMANRLAKELDAHLRLLMPYEVPYALPLNRPPVTAEFLKAQAQTLASQVSMEIDAHICLCRDKHRALRLLLTPHSVVIVGGKKRWWPTPEQRLAHTLAKDGHHVVFAELR
jgi:hypothetical protein